MAMSLGKAIVSVVLALTLGSVTVSAQEGNDAKGPLWSSAGRQVQITGKVICTECSLEEARKMHPHLAAARLYVVKTDQGQMVTELSWISNPQWGDRLTTPHAVQLRADERLLQKIFAKEQQSQTLHATGLLSHLGTLYVNEVKLVTTCSEGSDQQVASSHLGATCSGDFPRE